MFCKKLIVQNFRNIEYCEYEFSKDANILYGKNAQGKTNLIEALYLFSCGKSFRCQKEKEMVMFDRLSAQIRLIIENEKEYDVLIKIKAHGKKEIYINGYKAEKVSELIGMLSAVIFTPEHLSLLKSGPSERRKFLDLAICTLSPKYYSYLSEYNKILLNRNALLKKIQRQKADASSLFVWDEQLARYGAYILKSRNAYINKLNEYAKEYHNEISQNKEDIEIKYLCCVDYDEDINVLYERLLKAIRERYQVDLIKQLTTKGPHRDDFSVDINGVSVKNFGSQGQQRSAVLSLKLSEAKILENKLSYYPLLLLDDVLSELDSERQQFILNKIKNHQVIITTCDFEAIKDFKGKKTLIEGGKTV